MTGFGEFSFTYITPPLSQITTGDVITLPGLNCLTTTKAFLVVLNNSANTLKEEYNSKMYCDSGTYVQ